ncbi:MAG: hypothetical protein O2960_20060 [Verrucomicrobia bacterium]|nr:hypothetical protein [Verrucomicrobiota bacterium]
MKKIISLIALTAMLAVPVLAQTSANVRVNTLNALVQLPILSTNLSAMVSGNAAIGDGGFGGDFIYDSTSSAATNVYSVFKPAATTGRWIRRNSSDWNQFTVATAGTGTTYAMQMYRNLGTNVFGIGADNNNVYMQSWASYDLYLNGVGGNDTILNAAGGKVGIGITAPTSLLHIKPTANVPGFDIEATTGTSQSSMKFNNTGGTAYIGITSNTGSGIVTGGTAYALTLAPPSGRNLQFGYNGTTGVAVTIDTNGYVGIGTTAPGNKLQVTGDGVTGAVIGVSGSATGGGSVSPAASHTSASMIRLGLRGAVVAVDDAGLGPIGTYYGDNFFFSNVSGTPRYLTTAAVAQMNAIAGVTIFRRAASGTANTDITFLESMRIDVNGNVGIGTTTPISPFEVEAGLTTVGSVLTLGTKEPSVVVNDVLGRVNFYAPLDAAGTDANLVAGSIVAEAEGTFSATSNATSLLFQTGSSEVATTKMSISSAGAVAIPAPGTLALGGGSAIAKILSASSTLDFPSIPLNSSTNLQILVTGATTNSACFVSWASGVTPAAGTNLVLSASVESAGIVAVKAANASDAGAVDATAAGVRVVVFTY